ncbi:(2Fe-2S)-binding protein [Allosalinactinospora lopnorensis]|uniref:(2Fe-2S)-binding protein n=1 Tax=Allosalinactinospora lopnorensis TaxID=1352348 RepID=UPI000623ECCB|nr:(2Fe-2S)-binding protein [Allosalinactinospora lopnorensis]
MTDPRLHTVLSDIGAINAFFAVDPEPPDEGRHPVAALWNRPDLLAAEIAGVRTRLAERAGCAEADVEPRVAASILYQGLASRLLSPVIGAVLCHGRSPEPAALCWFPVRSGPLAFALDDGAGSITLGGGAAGNLREAADLVGEHVLHGLLAPIGAALRAQAKVAPRLLWGNAASSLAGAVTALAAARPQRADDAYTVAGQLLAGEQLTGQGEFVRPGGGPRRFFVRTSCCLYYRIPGCAKCGDCALLSAGTRLAQWAETPPAG